MPKCDFNKVARHECCPVNLLHIYRTPFPKRTSGGLLLIKNCLSELKIVFQNSSRDREEVTWKCFETLWKDSPGNTC